MKNEDEQNQKDSFQVKDRRRFDEEGNQKDGVIQNKEKPQESPSNPEGKSEILEEGNGPDSQREIDFSSFVMSLATQTLFHLGAVPSPEGVNIPVDPLAAKETIDILSMIQTKTKGNLDAAEGQLMDEILHHLRMTFIQMNGGKGK